MSEDFNVNDPTLWDFVPEDIDASADLKGMSFGPPPDGDYVIKLKLRPETEKKPQNPYISPNSKPGFPNLVAAFSAQLFTADGSGRGFANDFYASSNKRKNQKTASMHFILKVAGSPVPDNAPLKVLKAQILKVFEAAGDDGIEVYGFCSWSRRVRDANDPTGQTWVDIVGKKQVSEYNIAEIKARMEGDDTLTDAEKAAYIQMVEEDPSIYFIDVDDGTKQVQARMTIRDLKPRPVVAGA